MIKAMKKILAVACAIGVFDVVVGVGGVAIIAAMPGQLVAAKVEARPFRLRSLKLLPDVDEEKPIGRDFRSGFAVHGDSVIGDFGDGWLGSRVFTADKFNWWFNAGGEVTSPMANLGGFVVFGVRSGKVFKVDIATGKRAWEASLDSFSDRKPVLAGNTLLIQTSAQVIYAIDYQTGKSIWLFDAGFPDGLTVGGGASPLVFGDMVMAGLASGEVVAVDLQSGKQSWRVNPSISEARFRDVVGEMHVKDGLLYLTRYDGVVAAVDTKSSDIRTAWQEKFPAIASSTHRNGTIYVGCANGDVMALDEGNQGRQLWRTMTGSSISTLTAAETRLVSSASDGRVFAFDIQSGAVQWRDNAGYNITAQPLFMADGIYFVTGLGNAYGYRM